MAFVDPAADPEYIFHAYDRFNYVQKDPNFNTPEEIKKMYWINRINLHVNLKSQTQTMNVMV